MSRLHPPRLDEHFATFAVCVNGYVTLSARGQRADNGCAFAILGACMKASKLHRCAVIIAGTTFFLIAGSVSAEPRVVRLTHELTSARIVARARITSYEPDGLRFRPVMAPQVILTARYSDDPSWNPLRFVPKQWKEDAGGRQTGKWPPLQADVLIVVDAQGVLSLFAWPQGATYRFWSPAITGSVALFECEPPAAPIELLAADRFVQGVFRSWDGCVVPMDTVKTVGVPAHGER